MENISNKCQMSKMSLWIEKGFCILILIVLSKLKYSVITLFVRTYGKIFNAHFLKKQMV